VSPEAEQHLAKASQALTKAATILDMRRFLTRGYDIKSVADYAIGPDAVVPVQEAIAAIDTATRFVGCIGSLLVG
jgi:hypothetical protein